MQRVFRERSVLSSNALTPGPACLSDHLFFSTHFNSGRKKVVSVRGVSVEFLCQERKSQMRAQVTFPSLQRASVWRGWVLWRGWVPAESLAVEGMGALVH